MTYTIWWQRAEGAIIFAAALAGHIMLGPDWPWWVALLLFFAPDTSFAAYTLGPRIGAAVYNTVHIYALGVALVAVGALAGLPVFAGLGLLWLAHAGFDRALGYGLKRPDAFTNTHLGQIGRKQDRP